MEQILFGLQCVELSVDDVIIHVNSFEELVDRFRAVFERYVGKSVADPA